MNNTQALCAAAQASASTPAADFVTPSITWLNMSGDVTLTWDESNREQILALVNRKMKEGYSFFVLTPRFISVLGNKKSKLTNASQLDNAVGVVVPDSQVAAIVKHLGDPDLETAVQKGTAHLHSAPKSNLNTTRRATSAEEVVSNQSVAVRAIVGG